MRPYLAYDLDSKAKGDVARCGAVRIEFAE